MQWSTALGWPTLAGLMSAAAACDSLEIPSGAMPSGAMQSTQISADVTVRIDPSQRYQTLDGFGAALAYYDNWLFEHPSKAAIYPLLFEHLGLDILRLRNLFQYQTGPFAEHSVEFVREATQSLGHPPRVLMSSWSPPASLKASGRTVCNGEATCTLERDTNGGYVYEAFGQYWRDAVEAYAELGITLSYISVQNEPDFIPPNWEGCRFSPDEGDAFPGYALALDAVHEKVSTLEAPPKIIGPENASATSGQVERYAASLDASKLYAMAHHLYGGSEDAWRNPDSYVPAMRGLARQFAGKPLFQTEFAAGRNDEGGFETAWLIQNAMVEEGASAYLYWDLIWERGSGLVSLENPWEPDTWETTAGFELRPAYYAVRHFARFTDPGDVRVDATASTRAIRVSAFEAPDHSRLTLVLLNIGLQRLQIAFEWDLAFEWDNDAPDAQVYTTTSDAPWQESTMRLNDALTVPPRAIVTLVVARN